MKFLKKNYGWMIVVILAILPIIPLLNFIHIDFSNGLNVSLVKNVANQDRSSTDMLYHISGEFAIRWMTAVLTCTPFFILFGVNNLFVRQAMGIVTAVWSFIHFILFVIIEGFLETFTQVNYVLGFIAILMLIPLVLTSNRKSMKLLKRNWKKIQSFAYLIVFLSIIHVVLLQKTWLIYAIIVGIGFIIRIPIIKHKIIELRKK
ncbi:ferric reductase-like transmembrane domain-containing protein [Winogradskyella litoriviva]|uniref:Ferric reductase-like transmembrane domain-containing protein n=1 Tax=Winogradskyella litoriviva TaxID=1220182 RepID=A0ABX2E6B7_9FLAO|nr:ferric reductase-like transmembrane domain-containing protein [Winogradskyella litoriviva]NRD23648.1 ferric reductase-like transmembrane domain-containing protein [Winogradskyella litoriviva]